MFAKFAMEIVVLPLAVLTLLVRLVRGKKWIAQQSVLFADKVVKNVIDTLVENRCQKRSLE